VSLPLVVQLLPRATVCFRAVFFSSVVYILDFKTCSRYYVVADVGCI
jgi:hypothetical protein